MASRPFILEKNMDTKDSEYSGETADFHQGESSSKPAAALGLVTQKTQTRHAIELIADYYEQHDELGRSGTARRSSDDQLLDVIRGVLHDLTQTTDAYINEKGNETQRREIARLTRDLKTAKSPQTDDLARVNGRLIAAQREIDELRTGRGGPTSAELILAATGGQA